VELYIGAGSNCNNLSICRVSTCRVKYFQSEVLAELSTFRVKYLQS